MKTPDTEQIAAWKEKYGKVYSTVTANQTYIFRSLTFKELEIISSSAHTWSVIDLEDFILKRGLLYPDYDFIENQAAGLASSLADEIRDASGLGDAVRARATLDAAREASNQLINVAKTYILTTMPAYKEEDLESFTATQLFHKVAMAEKIIYLQQQIITGNELTFVIVDPKEEEEKQAKEEEKKRKRLEEFQRKGGHYSKDQAPPIKPRIATDDPIAAKLRRG